MNERIQELAEQAYTIALKESKDESGPNLCAPGSNYFIGLAQEKFAELIVTECAKLCQQVTDSGEFTPSQQYASASCRNKIKEHFGIE